MLVIPAQDLVQAPTATVMRPIDSDHGIADDGTRPLEPHDLGHSPLLFGAGHDDVLAVLSSDALAVGMRSATILDLDGQPKRLVNRLVIYYEGANPK